MQRSSLLLLSLALYSGALLLSLRTSEKQSLIVHEDLVSFNSVITGEILHGQFVLENFGDKPIQLLSVHPSCGCTATNFESKVLLTGEKVPIEFDWDTTRKIGEIKTELLVSWRIENMQRQYLRLKASAVVKGEYEIKPRDVTLHIGDKNTGEQVIRVVSKADDQILIRGATCSIRAIKMRVFEEKDAVAVSLDPKFEGKYPDATEVVLALESKSAPVVKIPVIITK